MGDKMMAGFWMYFESAADKELLRFEVLHLNLLV